MASQPTRPGNMNLNSGRCPAFLLGFVTDILRRGAERHLSQRNYAASAAFSKEVVMMKHNSSHDFLDQSKSFRLEIAQVCFDVAAHAKSSVCLRGLSQHDDLVKKFAEALSVAHEALNIRKNVLGLSNTLTIESVLQVASMEHSAGHHDRAIAVSKTIKWDAVEYNKHHTALFVKTCMLIKCVFESLGDHDQAACFSKKASRY